MTQKGKRIAEKTEWGRIKIMKNRQKFQLIYHWLWNFSFAWYQS
jgi:hypothetical protein